MRVIPAPNPRQTGISSKEAFAELDARKEQAAQPPISFGGVVLPEILQVLEELDVIASQSSTATELRVVAQRHRHLADQIDDLANRVELELLESEEEVVSTK